MTLVARGRIGCDYAIRTNPTRSWSMMLSILRPCARLQRRSAGSCVPSFTRKKNS
jgi:hypothetical protein